MAFQNLLRDEWAGPGGEAGSVPGAVGEGPGGAARGRTRVRHYLDQGGLLKNKSW